MGFGAARASRRQPPPRRAQPSPSLRPEAPAARRPRRPRRRGPGPGAATRARRPPPLSARAQVGRDKPVWSVVALNLKVHGSGTNGTAATANEADSVQRDDTRDEFSRGCAPASWRSGGASGASAGATRGSHPGRETTRPARGRSGRSAAHYSQHARRAVAAFHLSRQARPPRGPNSNPNSQKRSAAKHKHRQSPHETSSQRTDCPLPRTRSADMEASLSSLSASSRITITTDASDRQPASS